MLNMVEEFVRTALIQLGSVRNAMITDDNHLVIGGCQVRASPWPLAPGPWQVRASQLRRPTCLLPSCTHPLSLLPPTRYPPT